MAWQTSQHTDTTLTVTVKSVAGWQLLRMSMSRCVRWLLVLVGLGLVLGFDSIGYAQYDLKFVRLYPAIGMTGGLASLRAPNGVLYVTGQYQSSPNCKPWLSAMTECGTVLWTVLYQFPSITSDPTGGLSLAYVEGGRLALGAGDPPILLLLQANSGSVLWGVRAVSPGKAYVVGLAVDTALDRIVWTVSWSLFGTDVAQVLVVDYSGSLIWSKEYVPPPPIPANQHRTFHQALVLADTTYVFCGIVHPTPNGFGSWGYDVWVMRTDTQGNVLWSRIIGGQGHEGFRLPYRRVNCGLTPDRRHIIVVASTTTPSFLTAGGGTEDLLVMKLDIAGNLLWAKTYGSADRERPKRVQTFPDGRIAIVGDIEVGIYVEYAYLLIVDSMGQMLVARRYSYGGFNETQAVGLDLAGDDLLISMYAKFSSSSSGNYYDALLVKTDATGAVPCGMDTLIWQSRDVTALLTVNTQMPSVTVGPTIDTVAANKQPITLSDTFLCITCTIVDAPDIRILPRDTVCFGDSVHIAFGMHSSESACLFKTLDGVYVPEDTIHTDTFSVGMHVARAVVVCTGDSLERRDTFWVVPPPQAQVSGETTVCEGDTGFLQAIVTSSGSGAPYTYWWSGADWLSCPGCDTTRWWTDTPTVIELVVADRLGCTDTVVVPVSLSPLPVFDLPDTVVCRGDSLWVVAPGGVRWRWHPDSLVSCDTCMVVEVFTGSSARYWLTVWSAEGCRYTDSFWVVVREGAPPRIWLCPDTVWVNSVAELHGWVAGGGVWWWASPDGVLLSSWEDSVVRIRTPVRPGERDTFILWSVDSTGCVGSDTCVVLAYEDFRDCAGSVWVPNTFTPNGDGKNDVLYVYTLQPVEIKEWRIYTRWGEEVFSVRDVPVIGFPYFRTVEGWNGSVGGQPARSDVYVWWLRFRCGRVEVLKKGDVTLLR